MVHIKDLLSLSDNWQVTLKQLVKLNRSTSQSKHHSFDDTLQIIFSSW